MSFGSSVSERFFMRLHMLSVVSINFMVGGLWEFMWLNNQRSLMMWLNNGSVWDKSSMVEISISIAESMVNSVINCMTIIMGCNIGCSMDSEFVVGHSHVMVWLFIKAVLNVMCIVSIWDMSIVVVCSLVMHVMKSFREVVGSINCWSMVCKGISLLAKSLFTISLLILNFGSIGGLIFMRGHLVVSVRFVIIDVFMVDWAICWHMHRVVDCFVSTNVVRCGIGIVVWNSSVSVQIAMMGISMSIEVLIMSCDSMVCISVSVNISMMGGTVAKEDLVAIISLLGGNASSDNCAGKECSHLVKGLVLILL